MPPSASCEAADLAFERAGERALLVPEQLAFDEVGGDRAAIDRDHRLLAARGGGVDRLGDDFLADAALALDQHGDAGAGGLGGDRERGAEIGRGADDLVERRAARGSFRSAGAVRRRALARDRGVERGEQALGGERLDQEIGRAGAHRRDGVRRPSRWR